jgi:hypothetical protein
MCRLVQKLVIEFSLSVGVLNLHIVARHLPEFNSESPAEPPYACRGYRDIARCIDRAVQGIKVQQDHFFKRFPKDRGGRVFRGSRVTSEPGQFQDYLKYVDKVRVSLIHSSYMLN